MPPPIRCFTRLKWLLLLILLMTMPMKAQEGFDAVVPLKTTNTEYHAWSSDSTRFVFSDVQSAPIALTLPDPGWTQYDVTTNTLTTHFSWPLQPALNSTELKLFKPDGFIYSAPNNKFLFYSKSNSTKSALANRDLAQEEIIDVFTVGGMSALGNGFELQWSDNSTAVAFSFALGEEGPSEELYYFYFPDANATFRPSMKTFWRVIIEGLSYSTVSIVDDKLYDLSADGGSVLLVGRNLSEDTMGPARLIVWTPDDPNGSRVITDLVPDSIRVASFAPSSNTKLLILDEQANLIEYDVITGKMITLRSQITPTKWFRAWFSPNAQWLAIESDQLYFLNVGKLLEAK